MAHVQEEKHTKGLTGTCSSFLINQRLIRGTMTMWFSLLPALDGTLVKILFL